MKTMMTILGLAIATAPLAACYVAPAPGYGGPVAYQASPPRPVVVVRPRPVIVVAPQPRPVIVVGQPRRVWIAGHHGAYGNWIPGHWA